MACFLTSIIEVHVTGGTKLVSRSTVSGAISHSKLLGRLHE